MKTNIITNTLLFCVSMLYAFTMKNLQTESGNFFAPEIFLHSASATILFGVWIWYAVAILDSWIEEKIILVAKQRGETCKATVIQFIEKQRFCPVKNSFILGYTATFLAFLASTSVGINMFGIVTFFLSCYVLGNLLNDEIWGEDRILWKDVIWKLDDILRMGYKKALNLSVKIINHTINEYEKLVQQYKPKAVVAKNKSEKLIRQVPEALLYFKDNAPQCGLEILKGACELFYHATRISYEVITESLRPIKNYTGSKLNIFLNWFEHGNFCTHKTNLRMSQLPKNRKNARTIVEVIQSPNKIKHPSHMKNPKWLPLALERAKTYSKPLFDKEKMLDSISEFEDRLLEQELNNSMPNPRNLDLELRIPA